MIPVGIPGIQLGGMAELTFWMVALVLIVLVSLGLTLAARPYLRPDLSITLEWCGISPTEDLRTEGPRTLVFFIVTIRNSGMPSIADSWTAAVASSASGEVLGRRVSLIEPRTLEGKDFEQVFVPNDWLIVKGADSPIPSGGHVVGVYVASFPAHDELWRPGTRFRISCRDYFGVERSDEFVWRGHTPPPRLQDLASPPATLRTPGEAAS